MENRNVRKSKKAIQKAFAELLSEKNDINKITVKEITKKGKGKARIQLLPLLRKEAAITKNVFSWGI